MRKSERRAQTREAPVGRSEIASATGGGRNSTGVDRVAKFAISLAFHAFAEARRAIGKLLGHKQPPTVVAIYYHHVLDSERDRFAYQLDHLLRWTIPIRADHRDSLPPAARYSIVTADDGWISFAKNAVPELESRKIPVTIFAMSHRLGESVDGITWDRVMTEEKLRELRSPLVTIGSHTATHARMTTLDEHAAMRELRDSRLRLSSIIGEDVNMFCFPYGDLADRIVPFCKEAGYQRVFAGSPGLADLREYVVPRVRVDPSDWPLEFHLKVMGAYRWLPTAIRLKRWIRSAGRDSSRDLERSQGVRSA